jgi:hypothetical protein
LSDRCFAYRASESNIKIPSFKLSNGKDTNDYKDEDEE